jgi:hypothetical protein
MSSNIQKGKKSPIGSFSGPDPQTPLRTLTSKENIDIMGEIKEEPLKNIFVSAINPKTRANIAQTIDKHDMLKRSSSFARIKSKPFQINFFEYYKIKKDFCLLTEEERNTLLEDLYEFDKCFYLNQSKVEIHKNEDDSRLISEKVIGLLVRIFWKAQR